METSDGRELAQRAQAGDESADDETLELLDLVREAGALWEDPAPEKRWKDDPLGDE